MLASPYFDLAIDLRRLESIARERRLTNLDAWSAALKLDDFTAFAARVAGLSAPRPAREWIALTRELLDPGDPADPVAPQPPRRAPIPFRSLHERPHHRVGTDELERIVVADKICHEFSPILETVHRVPHEARPGLQEERLPGEIPGDDHEEVPLFRPPAQGVVDAAQAEERGPETDRHLDIAGLHEIVSRDLRRRRQIGDVDRRC